ncbi:MAG TPA: methionine--tRNA ligase, partial [Polyangia bacterium]
MSSLESSDLARFYVTTPIYYVNATPHLGTFYSTVVADALARFHRAQGDDTFFLTGLDEHGQKIERIAAERGVQLQAYCDGIAAKFQEAWKRAEISNDDFVRTTQERHQRAVAEMWGRMQQAGDIYPAEYDGMYCVGCEDWKSEDDVVTVNGEKVCPIHQRPVERVKEKNYFFRLSKYAEYLLELYERPGGFIQPESRKNEVASFLRGGLKDISISRLKKSVAWAIPVPGDAEHTVYVWIDALTNYLTVLGGPNAVEESLAAKGRAGELWRNCTHIIAKDILRFHAVYWPAMLKSAGLPPPRGIFCHGYLTVKGQKISKSMPATKVDPLAVADDLDAAVGAPVGIELLRYFVLREYQLGGDGDFTYESLLQRYESDLGNDLGNLLNRTVNMAHQYLGGRVEATTSTRPAVANAATTWWNEFKPAGALNWTWEIIAEANRYIDEKKPWVLAKKLAEDPSQRTVINENLAHCCGRLRLIAHLVSPAMPETSKKILAQLGLADDAGWREDEAAGIAWPGATLGKAAPLFPRIDPDRKAALLAKWQPAPATAPAPPAVSTVPVAAPAAPAADAPPAAVDKAAFDAIDLR